MHHGQDIDDVAHLAQWVSPEFAFVLSQRVRRTGSSRRSPRAPRRRTSRQSAKSAAKGDPPPPLSEPQKNHDLEGTVRITPPSGRATPIRAPSDGTRSRPRTVPSGPWPTYSDLTAASGATEAFVLLALPLATEAFVSVSSLAKDSSFAPLAMRPFAAFLTPRAAKHAAAKPDVPGSLRAGVHACAACPRQGESGPVRGAGGAAPPHSLSRDSCLVFSAPSTLDTRDITRPSQPPNRDGRSSLEVER